jgi:deoxyribodipyrimidine photo-lyase
MQNLSERVRKIKDRRFTGGNVVYWMSREQRVDDNWSLIYAAESARSYKVPLCVVYCLPPEYLDSTIRQYSFKIEGLKQVQSKLHGLGIGFYLLEGYPEIEFPSFLHEVDAGLLVTDFDPIEINRRWTRRVGAEIDIAMHQVDSHNIVPCWKVAKRRISTYETFRLRITPWLDRFLTDLPPMNKMEMAWSIKEKEVDWEGALGRCRVDNTVPIVKWIGSGEDMAKKYLSNFCEKRLFSYKARSMDPVVSGQSDLSPFLHFGQLSSQRVAFEVQRTDAPTEDKAMYLDQLIVKKELADNFCLHTPDYDTTGAFPIWARRSLDEHRSDPRDHIYSLEELENAKTHDPLWNAAQTELLKTGKIHGSLRAYWAEKILEWSARPENALSTALFMNNRYSLDGNDPIGYTGIAMVVGGLYGKPWKTKEVIGKLKMHTYTQERFSYDINAYYEKVSQLK